MNQAFPKPRWDLLCSTTSCLSPSLWRASHHPFVVPRTTASSIIPPKETREARQEQNVFLQIFSQPCSERRVKILTGMILIIIKPPWLYTDSFPWEIVRKRGTEVFWLWNEIFETFLISKMESTTGWHYVFWSWLASKFGGLTNIFSYKNHKRVGKKIFDSLLGKLKICHLFSALQPLINASAERKRRWLFFFRMLLLERSQGATWERRQGGCTFPSHPHSAWLKRVQQKLAGFSHLRFKKW